MRQYFFLVGLVLVGALAGCGSTIQVGGGSDGGPNGDGSAPGSDGGSGGSSAGENPHYGRCATACAAPSTGPCKSADVSACIEQCLAAVDGLTNACAQCIVGHSGYSGLKCENPGAAPHDPIPFGPGAGATSGGCPSGGTTCATCPDLCPCTPDLERCDGFKIGGTGSACTAVCQH